MVTQIVIVSESFKYPSEVLRQSAFPDLERLFLPCGCLERPVRHDIINKPPASAGRR
jgi:hypothetical protein